jgi:hypothetical protein
VRFRRCCVDVDDTGQVVGASVEFFGDRKVDPEQIAVLARGQWSDRTPAEVLAMEVGVGWYQEALPFDWMPISPAG